MSSRHLLGCAAALLTVGALIAVLAPSGSTLAVAAAFLLCPLVMLVAMKLLMGGGRGAHEEHDPLSRPPRPQEVRR